jgi:uncharacterized repeat protein (TIGR01451 family)
MNDSHIVHRAGNLAAIAVAALILWMGAAVSASAQTSSISPTQACNLGPSQVAAGWTIAADTPDCVATTHNAQQCPTNPGCDPWYLPTGPYGETRFVQLHARLSQGGAEGIATTITGLQAGRAYIVRIYKSFPSAPGNPSIAYGNGGFSRCLADVTINNVAVTTVTEPVHNAWIMHPARFVANGPTASFRIMARDPASIGCKGIYSISEVVPETQQTDLQMTKAVSPTGAVASGSILTYTLVARNTGPDSTNNVLLRDTPGAGLDCTTPSPSATCSASGGASCPGATVPVSSLTGGGVSLPSLPVGGQVAVTMQCTVTATGR